MSHYQATEQPSWTRFPRWACWGVAQSQAAKAPFTSGPGCLQGAKMTRLWWRGWSRGMACASFLAQHAVLQLGNTIEESHPMFMFFLVQTCGLLIESLFLQYHQ